MKSITSGPILPALFAFFFPILAGTLFQQLYNTVDAVIVGRYVGKEALAAVGGGTAVYLMLLLGFFVGVASGTGIVISQFYGAKNYGEVSRSVHTTFLISIIGGVLVFAIGALISRSVLVLIGTPDEILNPSLSYLRIYFIGIVPMFVFNEGSGILRAVGDSKTPLYILIIGCILNIILDIVFVKFLALGIEGAAWATVISQSVCALLVTLLFVFPKEERRKSGCALRLKDLRIAPHILKKMLRIGLPTGVQTSFYTLSNMIIQSNINSFGTDTIAAWAAYGKIDAVFWMVVSTMGMAVTTFSGQNFGAGLYDRIKKSAWWALFITAILTGICCLLFIAFGEKVLSLFASDENVVAIGVKIIRFLAPTWITYISIEILSGIIRGTGRSLGPTIITLLGVCVLRVAWIFAAVPLHRDVLTVLASYPLTWTVTSICFWIYYVATFKKFSVSKR